MDRRRAAQRIRFSVPRHALPAFRSRSEKDDVRAFLPFSRLQPCLRSRAPWHLRSQRAPALKSANNLQPPGQLLILPPLFLTLSSSGLGHRPFTAVTRVRIPLGSRRPRVWLRRQLSQEANQPEGALVTQSPSRGLNELRAGSGLGHQRGERRGGDTGESDV